MTPAPVLASLVGGALAMGFIVASLFFLKFWRRTHDPLFLSFAAAFVLFALNQVTPVLFGIPRENQSSIYLLRLAGFGLIIFAILRKNLRERS
jgi:hypothetical protein